MKRLTLAGMFASGVFLTQLSQAALVVTVSEVGGDVVFTSSGTLDLSLWTGGGVDSSDPGVAPSGAIGIGMSSATDLYVLPVNFSGSASIGPGLGGDGADFGTGDLVTLTWPGTQRLEIVQGYVNGDPINGTATFSGASFDSLGLAPGSYGWTWDTAGGGTDSFTVNIIPEPSSALLLALGALCFARRRRKIA